MTQVHISNPTHTVTINHDGTDLAYVVDKAQKLWDDTTGIEPPAGPGIGFTSQIAQPPYRSTDLRRGGEIRPVRAEDA
jgi:hypothetical protein